MALSHAFGRPVHMLGPHVAFFTDNEDVTLVGDSRRLAAHSDFWDGQVDLRGLHHSSISLRSDNGSEGLEVSVWKKSRPEPDSHISLPAAVLQAVAEGWLLYVEIKRPRVRPHENGFAKIWRSLMTEPIIPFDRELRHVRFGRLYVELATFVEKWEALRECGPAEAFRRFQRRYTNDTNTLL